MLEKDKVICDECHRISRLNQLLSAANPFEAEDEIKGCPNCKSIDCFHVVCDEPGCKDVATCGTPTKEGYRHTCSKHGPRS